MTVLNLRLLTEPRYLATSSTSHDGDVTGACGCGITTSTLRKNMVFIEHEMG